MRIFAHFLAFATVSLSCRVMSTEVRSAGTADHPDDILLPVSFVDEGHEMGRGSHYDPDISLHTCKCPRFSK